MHSRGTLRKAISLDLRSQVAEAPPEAGALEPQPRPSSSRSSRPASWSHCLMVLDASMVQGSPWPSSSTAKALFRLRFFVCSTSGGMLSAAVTGASGTPGGAPESPKSGSATPTSPKGSAMSISWSSASKSKVSSCEGRSPAEPPCDRLAEGVARRKPPARPLGASGPSAPCPALPVSRKNSEAWVAEPARSGASGSNSSGRKTSSSRISPPSLSSRPTVMALRLARSRPLSRFTARRSPPGACPSRWRALSRSCTSSLYRPTLRLKHSTTPLMSTADRRRASGTSGLRISSQVSPMSSRRMARLDTLRPQPMSHAVASGRLRPTICSP
mmetsp:Transcript_35458/g.99898  ORF Transcript_35458/g.99898 Transcript_35458/m.99898 type:complete len:329 (+) Transcript_35458:1105-2091(+)